MATSPPLLSSPLRPLDASLRFTAKFNRAALITLSLSLLSSRTLSKSSKVLLAPLRANRPSAMLVPNKVDTLSSYRKLRIGVVLSGWTSTQWP
ncbi:hypothetical protein OIU77_009622 [Salix suchowensis]|uniref:Uncharacterized protein n=1 Tax=Salix suchowensis TaxID=1278906 RepID=A0ABQ9AFR3_9ROSI|nr:hypothetical protein OIU77_009622 [Salix suchowensis]